MKPEELAEAQLIVEQYRNRPERQERQQLVDDISAAFKAGDAAGARIKARAAAALNIPLGPLAVQLNNADPIKKDARDSLDAIEGLTQLALAEPFRELAAAGLADPRERVFLKEFAFERGLRPDAPFPDQMEPGYAGPDAKRDGIPVNPFPEHHDPERDRQRDRVRRLSGSWESPAEVEARYRGRGAPSADQPG